MDAWRGWMARHRKSIVWTAVLLASIACALPADGVLTFFDPADKGHLRANALAFQNQMMTEVSRWSFEVVIVGIVSDLFGSIGPTLDQIGKSGNFFLYATLPLWVMMTVEIGAASRLPREVILFAYLVAGLGALNTIRKMVSKARQDRRNGKPASGNAMGAVFVVLFSAAFSFICCLLIICGLASIFKWMMIAGLALLGGVTALAGLAATAPVLVIVVLLLVKATEKLVSDKIEDKLVTLGERLSRPEPGADAPSD